MSDLTLKNATIALVDVNNQPAERAAIAQVAERVGRRAAVIGGDGTPEFLRNLDALFSQAERGDIKLETLILSGHSTGLNYFGGGREVGAGNNRFTIPDRELYWEEFTGILARYPKAAEQVHHVVAVGCYTGTRYYHETLRSVFPNALVEVGFDDQSPLGSKGAGTFLSEIVPEFFNLTPDIANDPTRARGVLKKWAALPLTSKTTASFTLGKEYGLVRSHSADPVEATYRLQSEFQAYLEARDEAHANPPDPHGKTGLRAYYKALQDSFYPIKEQMKDSPPQERERALKELEKVKEQTIRLIYFDNVKRHFVNEKSKSFDQLRTALEAAGSSLRLPANHELATLTRRQMRQLIERVEKLVGTDDAKAALEFVEEWKMVFNLVVEKVPSRWLNDPITPAASKENKVAWAPK